MGSGRHSVAALLCALLGRSAFAVLACEVLVLVLCVDEKVVDDGNFELALLEDCGIHATGSVPRLAPLQKVPAAVSVTTKQQNAFGPDRGAVRPRTTSHPVPQEHSRLQIPRIDCVETGDQLLSNLQPQEPCKRSPNRPIRNHLRRRGLGSLFSVFDCLANSHPWDSDP